MSTRDKPPAPPIVTEAARAPFLTPALYKHEASIFFTDANGAHMVTVTAPTVVGSSKDAAIPIADAAVSKLHAEVDPRSDGVWIRDLGSRNGIVHEGVLMHGGRIRVQDGTQLTLGNTVVTVRIKPASTQAELHPSIEYAGMLGRCEAMREVFARIEKLARIDDNVLIHGETGTGKELVARALHDQSPRRNAPFVPLDCGTMVENLLESELFGHVRGAFSGADKDRKGAFEAAEGGTLFLDEIGEMPLAMQVKLLRVLESRTMRRVGEPNYRKTDVRFVFATHRGLEGMVNEGRFREDLYHRIHEHLLELPPLRQRVEDIVLLYQRFLPEARRGLPISAAERVELEARQWSGNLRELRNFAKRAAVDGLAAALSGKPAATARPEAGDSVGATVAAKVARFAVPGAFLSGHHKDMLEAVVEWWETAYWTLARAMTDGSLRALAEYAGIHPSYVSKRLRRND